MKKNEKKEQTALHRNNPNVLGLRADVVEQRITDTLETNYMPCLLYTSTPQQVWEAKFFSPSKYCKNMFQVVSVHLPIVQKTIRLHLQ